MKENNELAAAPLLGVPAHTPRLPNGLVLPTDRLVVMGILNVTPDSFSDGGLYNTPTAAIDHAHRLIEAGADLIDIGGESTRPYSQRIDDAEEWARIGAIVTTLASEGLVLSVDTMHARTALRAADSGAAIINDISGGCFDPLMNAAVASTGCAYVVQQWRAFPGADDEDFEYGDVVIDVLGELKSQVGAALDAGVDPQAIIVDPGLGFSKLPAHSWELVGSMGRLRTLGYSVLIGASRKRFLAEAPAGDREAAARHTTRAARRQGLWAVRAHEVAYPGGLVRATGDGKDLV